MSQQDVEARLAALQDQVDRLARENRGLRLAALPALVLLFVVVAAGARQKSPVAKELKATRFVLQDDRGRDRIILESLKRKVNEFGDDRQETFSLIRLLDANGKERIELSTGDSTGLARIRMHTQEGTRRIECFTAKRGFLLIYDDKGKRPIEVLPRK